MRLNELKPGDLLLYKIDLKAGGLKKWVAKLIGFFQPVIGEGGKLNNTYSHVAMVDLDTNYLLEETWPRSRKTRITLPESPAQIEVFRVKAANDLFNGKNRVVSAVEWCYNHLGIHYDLALLLSFGVVDQRNHEVCSTFIGKAWLFAGVILSTEDHRDRLLSPDEIAANKIVLDFLGVLQP